MSQFSERDIQKWHWGDAIRDAAAGRVSGAVAELDKELRRTWFSGGTDTLNRQVGSPHAFLVPNAVLKRDLTAASAAGGGYLVGVDQAGFLDALTPFMVSSRLGATRLPGLVGNVAIPRMTAGATAYWLNAETTAITESQATFGQVALTPRTVGAYAEFSRQLLLQSAPTIDRVVARELSRRVAVAIDAAAINGHGNEEPTGILATASIGTFTGTSLDLAALVNGQSDLAAANVDPAGAAYTTTPAVAALLTGRQKFTGSDRALWEGSLTAGQVAGLPAIASSQIPAATMIVGAWEHLILGEWGSPLEIAVDPFAAFAAGTIAMRAMAVVDVAVAYAGAFSVATSIT